MRRTAHHGRLGSLVSVAELAEWASGVVASLDGSGSRPILSWETGRRLTMRRFVGATM